VNVLFVGESPPAGGTFFFLGDSLTQYTKEAFTNVYGVNFNSDTDFLNRFKSNYFYLDDLCLTPLNRLNENCRNEVRQISVPVFSKRLREHPPRIVISIMMAIEPLVREAIVSAGINVNSVYSLPFPAWGNNNKRRYVEMLTRLLSELKEAGLINPTYL
jgi:hypothetical protein